VSSDAATLQLQQLTAENAALLDAKVAAEKAAATVSSQVELITIPLACRGSLLLTCTGGPCIL